MSLAISRIASSWNGSSAAQTDRERSSPNYQVDSFRAQCADSEPFQFLRKLALDGGRPCKSRSGVGSRAGGRLNVETS